jgi:hypothetical protein
MGRRDAWPAICPTAGGRRDQRTCGVGLILYTWFVEVVSADGTGVCADGPAPHCYSAPLLDFKALAALSLALLILALIHLGERAGRRV